VLARWVAGPGGMCGQRSPTAFMRRVGRTGQEQRKDDRRCSGEIWPSSIGSRDDEMERARRTAHKGIQIARGYVGRRGRLRAKLSTVSPVRGWLTSKRSARQPGRGPIIVPTVRRDERRGFLHEKVHLCYPYWLYPGRGWMAWDVNKVPR
jgi:hypothetical protein